MFSKIAQSLCLKYMIKPLTSSPVPVCYPYGSCHQTRISMRYEGNSYQCNLAGREDQKPGWKTASRNRSKITDLKSEAKQKRSRIRPLCKQGAVICNMGNQGLVGNLCDSWTFESFIGDGCLTRAFSPGFLCQ